MDKIYIAPLALCACQGYKQVINRAVNTFFYVQQQHPPFRAIKNSLNTKS